MRRGRECFVSGRQIGEVILLREAHRIRVGRVRDRVIAWILECLR